MTKVKELVLKKTTKKTNITVKSLMFEVKKKLNEKKVKQVMCLLEEKYTELELAQNVVRKLERQIAELENKDIAEIETNYECIYEE